MNAKTAKSLRKQALKEHISWIRDVSGEQEVTVESLKGTVASYSNKGMTSTKVLNQQTLKGRYKKLKKEYKKGIA
jgi:hypothetical protein